MIVLKKRNGNLSYGITKKELPKDKKELEEFLTKLFTVKFGNMLPLGKVENPIYNSLYHLGNGQYTGEEGWKQFCKTLKNDISTAIANSSMDSEEITDI